ncbi:MAG: hypothetical protein JWL84_843 [Rhodospirillales bacterium]|nr:hypothetical protein [Rhodospirillales bacterium]
MLDALAEGQYSKVIAYTLGISVRTIEVHRARMLNRLGVRTTAEAVRLATLARLVEQAAGDHGGIVHEVHACETKPAATALASDL